MFIYFTKNLFRTSLCVLGVSSILAISYYILFLKSTETWEIFISSILVAFFIRLLSSSIIFLMTIGIDALRFAPPKTSIQICSIITLLSLSGTVCLFIYLLYSSLTQASLSESLLCLPAGLLGVALGAERVSFRRQKNIKLKENLKAQMEQIEMNKQDQT